MKCALALLLVLFASCSHSPPREYGGVCAEVSMQDIQEVVDDVSDLPMWGEIRSGRLLSTGQFNDLDNKAYFSAAKKMSSLTEAEIKCVHSKVILNLESDGYSPRVTRLNFFVLWRILFDIPAAVNCVDMHFVGLHHGMHSECFTDTTGQFTRARWPIVFDDNGDFDRIEPMFGYGQDYWPIADFDLLARKYPFRILTLSQ